MKWVIFVYVGKGFYNLQDFSILPESIKHLFRWNERGGSFKCSFPVAQSLILSGVLQNFPVGAKLGNISDSLCSFIVGVWDLGLGWFILDISPGVNVLEKGCSWQGRVWPAPTPLPLATFNPSYFWAFHLISGWRCTRVTSGEHKLNIWKFTLSACLPGWNFGFFCYFPYVLMTTLPSVGPSCWSFGGRTSCTELWDLLCLVKGLSRTAGRFEGSIPQCSCFFTPTLGGAEHTGSVPLSCSDGSFPLAIQGPGGCLGFRAFLCQPTSMFSINIPFILGMCFA